MEEGKISNKNYCYLGGRDRQSVCDGTSEEKVCATYERSGRRRENVKVQWLEKIESAVKILEEERTKPNVKAAESEGAFAGMIPAAMEEAAENEEPASQVQQFLEKIDNQEENGESQRKIPLSTEISNGAQEIIKKRSSPSAPETKIPYLATEVSDDSYLRTRYTWILLSALFV
ncbi:unnamed protein product [Trypanosoma congolense IL3000]|uniref:WGS project CAEQ00000000 data, annotated contig 765 n=1 Tax=Trypanosoma congolense (strain IL3000) TaxID=1068625 RepID=F9WIB9_TRYCI|nr:unnamed protein product [Trypanosoma congolense IL3000]